MIPFLCRFADRNFYDDWWNCTTYNEFARKWNKPVHEFLFRHVYVSSMHKFNWPSSSANVFTFFISALFHEYVFFMVCKKICGYMFCLQMLQIPLMKLQRRFPWTHPTFGNIFFWWSLMVGLPLLSILYSSRYIELEDDRSLPWEGDVAGFWFS
ncbi:hypothetical protein HMI55_001070 [Coelomomyces lativittatus]|nr:hypothetical protein HMI55_001070 [Coelomomyces lativittatus]